MLIISVVYRIEKVSTVTVGCGNACVGLLPKGSALADCYVIEASTSSTDMARTIEE